jgi:hypothetical protein
MCMRTLIPAALKGAAVAVLAATLGWASLGASGKLPSRLMPTTVSIAVTTAVGQLPSARR